MPFDEDPTEANHSEPRVKQTAGSGLTAGRDIQIGRIVQTIVYLGLPFNSRHLRFVQFLANSASLTCLIGGFIRLWQNGANFTTLLLLIIGSGFPSLTCLYYAWFWKPEAQDKSAPSSTRQRSRQRTRRLAIVGIVAVPLLTGAGFFLWLSLPPPHVMLLIADFDGVDPKNNQVTQTIIRRLRLATEPYADVKVEALKKTITEQQGSEVARAEGEQKKASIVIWGSYGVTPTNVLVSTHFEVLKHPDYFPKLGATARGEPQVLPRAELNQFRLQSRLSEEMSYLTMFTLGMVRYTKNDWEGAIARFSDALAQLKPETNISTLNEGVVRFYRGNAFTEQEDYNRAISDYNESLKRGRNLAEVFNNRGRAYAYKHSYDNYERAIADFTQAINLKNNSQFYLGRGSVYSSTSKYDYAIADYTQVINLKPNDKSILASAYAGRGNAYFQQEKSNQAIADLTQAIDLKPNHKPTLVSAYMVRGTVYNFQKRYAQSIVDYTQVINLKPNEKSILASTYLIRGVTYAEQSDYDRAIADLTQAINLKPNDKSILTQAINLKLKDESILANAYLNRGNAYVQKEKYDQAIADLTQAINLKPNNKLILHNLANAYNRRGVAHIKQGNYTQAIADFNKVIELKQNAAVPYYNIATVYSLKRDFKEAINNLQRAIQLDKKLRENAKTDSDFDNIRKDEQFRTLVGE